MLLELNGIYKTYVQGKLDVPVLKNVSMSVDSGEYVAIMGPSGSGKTTLMNIIGCLDFPTGGEYLLNGENIGGYSENELSDLRLFTIGFVFQSFYLLPRQSALENVALPLIYAGVKKQERMRIAAEALERVGLADRVNFKPGQLSGGQCQRVAIARAMVNNPQILLADEPTGALDTASGLQIMELFQRLNDDGVTIVMITHEQQVADHARTIYHIRDGRLSDFAPEIKVAPIPSKAEEASEKEREAPAVEPKKPAEQDSRINEALVDEVVSSILAERPYKTQEPHRPAAKGTDRGRRRRPPIPGTGRQPEPVMPAAEPAEPKKAKPGAPPANGGREAEPGCGKFRNPIKTEIRFDPSSWVMDKDEEES